MAIDVCHDLNRSALITADARWTTVQESEYPWERAALAYVRERLPKAEPFRAWSNFEFIGLDGSINEVDLLVVSTERVFLVEIKSAPGTVDGDAGTWTWRDKGHVRTVDNPLLLANRKAKKLKSLLQAQAALKRARVRMPYVEAVVFLSSKGVTCRLDGPSRQGVLLRDDAKGDTHPSVMDVLSGVRDGSGGPSSGIDSRMSRAIARGLEQAGIRASQTQRQVGDYVLEALLNETDVYQDWQARHVAFEDSKRRVRIYPNALASSQTTRQERRRAAQREYRLLEGVLHEGILRVEGYTDHERGPSLVFDHPEGAERLDAFVRQRLDGLDLGQRLGLVRQLAETLQYAHARRLYHQALTPQSVLVAEPGADRPQLKLFNWQAGTSELTTETTTRLTVGHVLKVGLAGEVGGAVYLAPELYSVGVLDPAAMDVFSLGALAYHVITGTPPAETVEALHAKLRQAEGLRPSEVADGVSEPLDVLVQVATLPDAGARWEVGEFLAELGKIEEELGAAEVEPQTHPIEAVKGDELEGGFTVRQRLGKGSTALALLVERDGQEGVLKVALSPDLNDRVHQEGRVLGRLRHQNVVELYDEVEVSGHAALFMAAAGSRRGDDGPTTYTLAQRVREEGRLSLDLLQRFGEELLGVVDWLEAEGVSHRDIKPDNVGIGQTPNGTLSLVLFDFSLSGTPAENIRAGTPPYLDPFLGERTPPRWDPYAERFAAAMTLYEMATGQLPAWGDGLSNPSLVEGEVTLDVELFDPSVREGLADFFETALARSYGARFDNADEMRRAWVRTFEGIDTPRGSTDGGTDEGDLGEVLEAATHETAVASLPLSPRVLNALERLGVGSLRDLQALPRIRLYRNKGIGNKTVKDIRQLAERVAERLASDAEIEGDGAVAAVEDPSVDPAYWSVDLVRGRLTAGQLVGDEEAVLSAFLGLGPGDPALWPTQQDVAEALGVTRERVREVVDRARTRWIKGPPQWVVPLRNDVADLVAKHGGVMTRDELVGALLAARGSAAPDGERVKGAAAAATAALEVEASRQDARVTLYRGRTHVLAVATPTLGEDRAASPTTRARYAETLGAKADEVAAADPLLTPERALEELRAVEPPEGEPLLSDDRLLRLAVAASDAAGLSSRLELYPVGMPAGRALKLGAGALLGPKRLTPEMVKDRVSRRYPVAEPLPDRPRLDEMLEAEGLHLRWDYVQGVYLSPDLRSASRSTGTVDRRTTTDADVDAPGAAAARALDERLERVASDRRLLTLTVAPRQYGRAAEEIEERFGLERVSLEGLVLDALRRAAAAVGADWDVVLRADAGDRGSRDWRRLQALVAKAVPAVEAALLALERPGLLVYPGLLARYGQLDVVHRLREACAERRAPGYVLLVPADALAAMPVIDGEPLPVVLRSDWERVPRAWLQNAHRGRAHASAQL